MMSAGKPLVERYETQAEQTMTIADLIVVAEGDKRSTVCEKDINEKSTCTTGIRQARYIRSINRRNGVRTVDGFSRA